MRSATLADMNLASIRFVRRFAQALTLLFASSLPVLLPAQAAQAPEFHSTVVHADRSVTFAFKDATALKVTLALEGVAKPMPMAKDAAGVWTITTGPLKPEIYGYHFEADETVRIDPDNTRTTINLLNPGNLLEVPGEAAEPWDMTNVPHGTLHHYLYATSVVVGLPANQSGYIVYTPPGYDANAKSAYPVLYLLHGWSDTEYGWIATGQANLIFDNLLAQGKIKPMVVVMPLGYGDLSFVHGHDVWNQPVTIEHNTSLFTQAS